MGTAVFRRLKAVNGKQIERSMFIFELTSNMKLTKAEIFLRSNWPPPVARE